MGRFKRGVGVFIPLLLMGCLAGLHRGEALHDPVVPRTPAESHGQVVYMKHCYRCHQGGEGGLGPALTLPLPDCVIRKQVRRGVGAMPAFPAEVIGDDELDDLLAYLKALRH